MRVNSIIGGCLIIAGLYLVTWACYKERQAPLAVTYVNRDSEALLVEEDSPPIKSSYHRAHVFSGSSVVLPRPWIEAHES